ncbi:MAG: class II fumarate hydratase [Bryobacterales bacterium]|nr:class II fumarate hydratase [Bryobacterales bacterium]
MPATRIERDTMGEMDVPAEALYGAQTQRAVQNFPISSLRFPRSFLRALGLIKWAAASANLQLGSLPPAKAQAILGAAERMIGGELDSQMVVDIYQTGSGTSTNMNANEVLAHLAGVHPNDDVNRGQSSNDVIPTAIHVAAAEQIHTILSPAIEKLEDTLTRRAAEFHGILKIGRTHLQDAVPMRMGQEFSGYARQVRLCRQRIQQAADGLLELALGGTAVGTGLNAAQGFAAIAIAKLAERTGLAFREASNHFEAQASKDGVSFLSGALKTYAVALTKIGNDIRWLGSGPRTGLGELRLPAVQPGSSIMPGKVNPVIAESLLMACAQVIGHDAAITWCCAAGNFELNVMMPLMAYDLLDSIHLLAAVSANFESRCIAGLEVEIERVESLVERSLAMATALVPAMGYERAASIAHQAHATGRTVREVAVEQSGLAEEEIRRLLDPIRQAGA